MDKKEEQKIKGTLLSIENIGFGHINRIVAFEKVLADFSEHLKLNQTALSKSIIAAMEASKLATLNLDGFLKVREAEVKRIADVVIQNQKVFAEIGVMTAGMLSQIAKNNLSLESRISSIMDLSFPLYQFESSINQEYLQNFQSEFTAVEYKEDGLISLFRFFESKIPTLKKGLVSAQGLILMIELCLVILTTLIYIDTINQSKINRQIAEDLSAIKHENEISNEYLENLYALGERVLPLIEELAISEKDEVLYIVKKESAIRAKPKSESETLHRVYPNQIVNIISEEKRWYYVEYFDHLEAIPKMGYIYKGNVTEFDK
jgi:hypothetical protein